MGALHLDIRRILADRHSPEAAALFRTLLGFSERRVRHLAATRCRGLLTDADQEEVIGEVLFQLMEGALGRFRGETEGELFAFVRTMCDRTATRRAQRRLRERQTLDDFRERDESPWQRDHLPAPDAHVDFEADSPLDEADRGYLRELLAAGSKAELARRQGVSRAAVTQRLHRIHARLGSLPPVQRHAHEAWMQRVAGEVLEEAVGPPDSC